MGNKKRVKSPENNQQPSVQRSRRRLVITWRVGVLAVFALGISLTLSWLAISARRVSLDILPNPELSGMERQVAKKIRLLRLEVEKNPKSSTAWGKLAMNLDIHGFKLESITCYRQAAALNPEEFRWPYYCAVALHEMGSSDAAKWFERSLTIRPNYAPLHVLHGRDLFNSGKLQESSKAFRRAIAVDPNLPHSYHGLAQIELSKSDLQASRNYLLRALRIEPRYSEAHGLLAAVYRRLGETQNAERELLYMKQLPEFTWLPDPVYSELAAEGVSSWWYQRRGLAYLANGLYEPAVKEFRMRVFLKPDAQSHNNLGLALQRLGNHSEALEQIQAALALDPDYVDALNNLAAILYERGQVHEAMVYVDKTLKLNPAFTDAYLNLGAFHIRAGNTAEAISAFRQGLAQVPHHTKLAVRLAWILATTRQANLRDGEEAVRLATTICEMTNYLVPENLDVLAAAYAEQGHSDKAIKTIRQAIELAKTARQDLVKPMQARLRLYEAKKPYRE